MKKRNEKDMAFARNLEAGMDQLEAYHAAGFKGAKQAASRKANSPEIRVLVGRLSDAKNNKQIIDRKWVLDELVKTYYRAVDDNEHQACRATLKDIGLEFGMFIERKDIRVHAMFEKLSDRDIVEQIAQIDAKALTLDDTSIADE